MGRRLRLTKKQKLKEFAKCGKDPNHFIRSKLKVSHPVRGVVQFQTYPFQRELVDAITHNQHTIILKARQLGISTISAAYILWLMMFHREKNIVVLATRQKTSSEMIKRVQKMYRTMPSWLREFVEIKTDNKSEFEFTNGSVVKAEATSTRSARGEAASLLVIDEAAHVENLDEIWKAVKPTLSTGGKCLALSTPNGAQGWFYKTWVEAVSGENGFYPIKLMWDVHPERDMAWFQEETKNMSPKGIAQEHECSFVASGDTVIDPQHLMRIEKLEVDDPVIKAGFARDLWIWEGAKPGKSYIIPVDVSRGDGSDYSTFHIICLDSGNQVAEFRSKVAYDNLAAIVDKNGRKYNDALVVVENAQLGHAVCAELVERRYPNIYYHEKGTHEYKSMYEAAGRSDVTPGFAMTTKTRPMVIKALEEQIRRESVTIRSARTLAELRTFIWTYRGSMPKAEAAKGKNDDLVMALAIACHVRDVALQVNERDVEIKKAMAAAITSKVKQKLDHNCSSVIGVDPNTMKIRFGNAENERQRKKIRDAALRAGWIIN